MKATVALRTKATQNLRLGNLRGEERWERQVLEACSKSEYISELYTAEVEWENGQSISPRYKGLGGPEDSILVMHDWNYRIATERKYKAIIVNVFAGPWLEDKPGIEEVRSTYGNKLLFSVGCPGLFDNKSSIDHLKNFLDIEDLILLPVPGAPYILRQDSFNNTNLLWTSRIIFLSTLGKDPSINWALHKLQQHPEMRLGIMTGWRPEEVTELIDGLGVKIRGDFNDLFWQLPALAEFQDVRSRVIVFPALTWEEALLEYKKSKIFLTQGRQLTGPPIEAAMYSVPYVSTHALNALSYCPKLLKAKDSIELYSLLDKLYYDKQFYEEISSAYCDYVEKTYTYEAFNSNLYNLITDRNIV